MPVDKRRISEEVLKPAALLTRAKLQCDPEKWNDYEIQQIISACGPEWASMSVENVRLQCCNLRKKGLLGTIGATKNHGKTKFEPEPDGYREYLLSPWWREFRKKILKGWDYKCCWCNSPDDLEVHHRTYERLGHEKLNDCVCLCKKCHVVAGRAKQRGLKNQDAQKYLFDEKNNDFSATG